MGKTITRPWDPRLSLETSEDMADYLDAGFWEGHPRVIMKVLEEIARARGISGLAAIARLDGEILDKSLSVNSNPDLTTLLEIVHALGLRLSATTLADEADEEADAEAEGQTAAEVEAGTESPGSETESIPAAAKVA